MTWKMDKKEDINTSVMNLKRDYFYKFIGIKNIIMQ